MRSLMLAAIAAFAFATIASADPINLPAGPYKLDANGKCHAANGQFVKANLCKAPPKQCRDPKTGKFVKCPAH